MPRARPADIQYIEIHGGRLRLGWRVEHFAEHLRCWKVGWGPYVPRDLSEADRATIAEWKLRAVLARRAG